MNYEPRLDEQFVVITESDEGGIEIDGIRYAASSVSLSNPMGFTEEMLAKTIEFAAREQKNDGRRRMLVRFKRKELDELGVKLVSVVPIGPVDDITARLRPIHLEKESILPSMTPAECAVLIESVASDSAGSEN